MKIMKTKFKINNLLLYFTLSPYQPCINYHVSCILKVFLELLKPIIYRFIFQGNNLLRLYLFLEWQF